MGRSNSNNVLKSCSPCAPVPWAAVTWCVLHCKLPSCRVSSCPAPSCHGPSCATCFVICAPSQPPACFEVGRPFVSSQHSTAHVVVVDDSRGRAGPLAGPGPAPSCRGPGCSSLPGSCATVPRTRGAMAELPPAHPFAPTFCVGHPDSEMCPVPTSSRCNAPCSTGNSWTGCRRTRAAVARAGKVNEPWARWRAEDVYNETEEEIAGLKGADPEDTLQKLVALHRCGTPESAERRAEHFCGQTVTIAVVHNTPAPCYQDGTPVSQEEVCFVPGTREGLLHGILQHGFHGSIDSHGTSRAWAFALESFVYERGLTALDLCSGCVLHHRCNRVTSGPRAALATAEGHSEPRRLSCAAMSNRCRERTIICHSARRVWGYEWKSPSAALSGDVAAHETKVDKRKRLVSKSEAFQRILRPRIVEADEDLQKKRELARHPRTAFKQHGETNVLVALSPHDAAPAPRQHCTTRPSCLGWRSPGTSRRGIWLSWPTSLGPSPPAPGRRTGNESVGSTHRNRSASGSGPPGPAATPAAPAASSSTAEILAARCTVSCVGRLFCELDCCTAGA